MIEAATTMAVARISEGEDPEDTEEQVFLFLTAKGTRHREARRMAHDVILDAVCSIYGMAGDCTFV